MFTKQTMKVTIYYVENGDLKHSTYTGQFGSEDEAVNSVIAFFGIKDDGLEIDHTEVEIVG